MPADQQPEAAVGGPLSRLRDGDMVRLDAVTGTLTALVPDFDSREAELRLARAGRLPGAD